MNINLSLILKKSINITQDINRTKVKTIWSPMVRWREKAFDRIENLPILHTFSKPRCKVTSTAQIIYCIFKCFLPEIGQRQVCPSSSFLRQKKDIKK